MENQNYQTTEGTYTPSTSYPSSQNLAPAMTVKQWLITYLIMLIPFVGLIFLFIWAFGSKSENPSKIAWAKASLIWMAIVLVLYIVLFIAFGAMIMSMGGFENGSSYL